MRLELGPCPLHLNEYGAMSAGAQAVINSTAARAVFGHYLVDVVPLPPELGQHREDGALPRGLLAARQQGRVGRNTRHCGLEVAHVPVITRAPIAPR